MSQGPGVPIDPAIFRVPPLGTLGKSRNELNPASWMHERLVQSIIDFEKKLDADSEIGARLVNFNAHEVISIDDVSFWGPDLIIFIGRNIEGHPVELMRHMSQVNVLLMAVPKQREPARRIGFILEEGLKRNKEE